MSFQYTLKCEDDIAMAKFSGRIFDKSDASDFMEDLDKAIEKGVRYLVIDFSGMSYINSSGLNVLITLLTKMRNLGGELYICQIPEIIEKLLLTSKLKSIFKIEKSLEDSIQKIKA